MDAKLTLKLDKDVIERAKAYAQERQESLSSMVERYFRYVVDQEGSLLVREISPVVRELSGIIELDNDAELRDDYTDYLLDKYK